MPEEEKSKGWWHSVPGILTAIAGVITAVTGLVIALNQIGVFDQHKKEEPQSTQLKGTPPPPPSEKAPRLSQSPPQAALLPAPQPTSPECGSTIPRPSNDQLMLGWTRVEGASTYMVEVDCFGCFGKRDWHSFGGSPWHLRTGLGIRSPIYSSKEVHAALRKAGGLAIRWRVWAVGHDGVEGQKSAWCQLAFAG